MGRTTMPKQQLEARLDDRRLRDGGNQGGICGIAHRPFPDPVAISLPSGETHAFALALEGKGEDWAEAGDHQGCRR